MTTPSSYKTIFANNAVAGLGLATGIYSASLIFIPMVEILTDYVASKKCNISNPIVNCFCYNCPPAENVENVSDESSGENYSGDSGDITDVPPA